MFPGFPLPSKRWIALPEALLDLQEDPYTLALLHYAAKRTYSDNNPEFRITLSQLADKTRIGKTKLREVVDLCIERGYLERESAPSGDTEGDLYRLRFARPEAETAPSRSFRAQLTAGVVRIVDDEAQTDRNGRKLSPQQRKVAAVQWAWREVFGLDYTPQPKTLTEMVASLGGSSVKAALWLLRNGDRQFEPDEKPDDILLAMLKSSLKKLGTAAEKRSGLGNGPSSPNVVGRQSITV